MRTSETTATYPGVKVQIARLGRVTAVARRVNLPLLAIVAAGLAFSGYYTLKITQWVVMTDELQYVKLAINVGQTLSPIPTVHGEYTGSLSQLYPILTAPVYQLFDMPTAFKAVHLVNAAIMASTAVPAYLLAREVVPSRLAAYLVAALTVAVPWMTMSTMILTEVAGYPAFAWAILAMQRAIAAPSLSRDLLAVAGVALAFLARTQFLLLALALPVAIVAHEVGFAALRPPRSAPLRAMATGLRRSVSEHPALAVAGGLAALAAAPLALAGWLGKILGRYEPVTSQGDLLPAGVARAAAMHLDFVAVGIGVLPFVLAAAWGFSTLLRPSEKRTHAFAVVLIIVVTALAFEVSSFNLRFALGGPVQDRYLFFIVPLLFVGMAACFLGARKPWVSVLVAGAGFAWLASLAQYTPSGLPFFASPDSVFHQVLNGQSLRFGELFSIRDLSPTTVIVSASLALSVASAAAIRYAPGPLALTCAGLAVLTFSVVETGYVFERIVPSVSRGRAVTAIPAPAEGRNWIDDAVPAGVSVGLVPSAFNSARGGKAVWFTAGAPQAPFWDTEFWNKTVARAYSYRGSEAYTPFHADRLSLDWETGALRAPDQTPYLVVSSSDVRFRPEARVIRKSPSGLDLLKPELPYRAGWATRGIREDGWTIAGEPVLLRLFAHHGEPASARRVTVIMQSAYEIKRPRRYRIKAGGEVRSRQVEPGASRRKRETFRVCVPAGRFSDVKIRIAGKTRLPAPDGRLIGLRITRIAVADAAGSCGGGPA